MAHGLTLDATTAWSSLCRVQGPVARSAAGIIGQNQLQNPKLDIAKVGKNWGLDSGMSQETPNFLGLQTPHL